MRLWKFLIHHWRLIYGIGLAFFIFYFILTAPGEPSTEADTIYYAPVMFREMGGMFLMLQAAFLVLGAVFCGAKRQDFSVGFLMALTPLLFAFIIVWNSSQPAIGDTRLWHRESVRVGNYVYNLAGYHLGQLVAYECDAFGIMCQVIYRGGAITSLEYKKECAVPPRWEVDRDTISLVVRCETVFTHPVPN